MITKILITGYCIIVYNEAMANFILKPLRIFSLSYFFLNTGLGPSTITPPLCYQKACKLLLEMSCSAALNEYIVKLHGHHQEMVRHFKWLVYLSTVSHLPQECIFTLHYVQTRL